MKPKVSVIIPTYNRCRLLAERSLPSVLKQSYKNLECIVVDDGSTDQTTQVVEEFIHKDSRIRYIKFPKNYGAATAINHGIRCSTGEYICLLDDDDEYLPTFLEETVKKLSSLPENFGGVSCSSIVDYGKGQKAYFPPPHQQSSFYTAISAGWLLRREVFFKSNIFFDEELSSDADTDFGIRFFQIYKADVINKPLKITHADRGRMHLSYPSERRLRELEKFLQKDLRFFKAAGKKELAWIYLFTGRNFCWGGKMKRGRHFLWRSLLTRPYLRAFFHLIAAYCGYRVYLIYWKLERALARFIHTHFTNRIPEEIKKTINQSLGRPYL
jgi:glycosyltransferase involved in cell wall biosynthesis